MTTTESPFDVTTAKTRLEALRAEARGLETQLNAHWRLQLRKLSSAAFEAQDAGALLEDVRRFVDERL